MPAVLRKKISATYVAVGAFALLLVYLNILYRKEDKGLAPPKVDNLDIVPPMDKSRDDLLAEAAQVADPDSPSQAENPDDKGNVCSQQKRFETLYNNCPRIPSKDDIDSMSDDEINKMSHWFLVAENLKTLTCMHYKAGWTSQRLILMNNSAENPTVPVKAADGRGQFNGIEKLNISYMSSDKYTVEQKRYIMKNYFAYTFVRHPLDRILSAYRDKLVVEIDPKYDHSGDYYTVMLPRILKKIRPDTYKELLMEPLEKMRLPFSMIIEFIKAGGFDWHFHGPYDHVCYNCKFKYDYIGKIETWDSDMDYIIDTKFPKKRGKGTQGNVNSEKMSVYYKRLEEYDSIVEEDIKFLETKYAKDFAQYAYGWEKKDGRFYAKCEGDCC